MAQRYWNVYVLLLWLLVGAGAIAQSKGTPADVSTLAGLPAEVLTQADLPAVRTVDHDELLTIVRQDTGKVVFLHVWATWCKPCLEEFPSMVKLRKKFSKKVEFILVSFDDPDHIDSKVRPALKKFGVNFLTYLGHDKTDEEFINALSTVWNGAIPATFIYTKKGVPYDIFVGTMEYEDYVVKIERSLKYH